VSLPASQQRVLDGIEDDLRGCEPRLVSMFSIFAMLTRDEGAPSSELLRLGAGRRWMLTAARLGTIIVVPLVLGLVALIVFVAVSSAGHGCRLGATPHSAATSRALSCQSAPEPEPPGHGS
jgi:hypothetical protein